MKQQVGEKKRERENGTSRNGEKESGGEAKIPKSEDEEINSDKAQELAPSVP